MESVKAELWSVFFSVELARKRGEELGGESWYLKAQVVFETVGKMFGHSVATDSHIRSYQGNGQIRI